MNKTIEIRKNIINKIESINDNSLLLEIYNMINSNNQEDLLNISEEQMESIKRGRQNLKDGNYILNEDLMVKMSEWLEKK